MAAGGVGFFGSGFWSANYWATNFWAGASASPPVVFFVPDLRRAYEKQRPAVLSSRARDPGTSLTVQRDLDELYRIAQGLAKATGHNAESIAAALEQLERRGEVAAEYQVFRNFPFTIPAGDATSTSYSTPPLILPWPQLLPNLSWWEIVAIDILPIFGPVTLSVNITVNLYPILADGLPSSNPVVLFSGSSVSLSDQAPYRIPPWAIAGQQLGVYVPRKLMPGVFQVDFGSATAAKFSVTVLSNLYSPKG